MRGRHRDHDITHEAQHAYLRGLVELFIDDPHRARGAIKLVDPAAFDIDHGREVFEAAVQTLSEIEHPTAVDFGVTIRRRHGGGGDDHADVQALFVDCVRAAAAGRCAYSLGIQRHAHEVMAGYRRRLVAEAAADLQATAADPLATGSVLVAAAQAAVAAGQAVSVPDPGWTDTAVSLIGEWREHEAVPVVETGFGPLDGLTDGGLPVGGLVAIAARPGAGKSALAIQAALGALERDPGLNVVYAAGEMTGEAFARRMICNWASRRPGLRPVSMAQAKRRAQHARRAAEDFETTVAPRLAVVRPPLTLEKIEAAVVATKAKLLVVDYLQLVVGAATAADRRAEVDGVVRHLRRITLEHGVACIAVSSIAKAVTEDTPIGSLGKETNGIDYDADLFLLGLPAAEADANGRRAVRWKVCKQRDGRAVDLETIFDGDTQTFEDNGTPVFEEFASFAPGAPR
jgi:replicative DNA helicase